MFSVSKRSATNPKAQPVLRQIYFDWLSSCKGDFQDRVRYCIFQVALRRHSLNWRADKAAEALQHSSMPSGASLMDVYDALVYVRGLVSLRKPSLSPLRWKPSALDLLPVSNKRPGPPYVRARKRAASHATEDEEQTDDDDDNEQHLSQSQARPLFEQFLILAERRVLRRDHDSLTRLCLARLDEPLVALPAPDTPWSACAPLQMCEPLDILPGPVLFACRDFSVELQYLQQQRPVDQLIVCRLQRELLVRMETVLGRTQSVQSLLLICAEQQELWDELCRHSVVDSFAAMSTGVVVYKLYCEQAALSPSDPFKPRLCELMRLFVHHRLSPAVFWQAYDRTQHAHGALRLVLLHGGFRIRVYTVLCNLLTSSAYFRLRNELWAALTRFVRGDAAKS